MLRISTRGRYALRAMVDLATHNVDGPVSRQDIADRQEISAGYVAQLFRELSAAGLVESVMGPGGGYLLTRDAAQISAYDIVRVVEGPITLVHCLTPDDGNACDRIGSCLTYPLWDHLSTLVQDELEKITLKDLSTKNHLLQEEIIEE